MWRALSISLLLTASLRAAGTAQTPVPEPSKPVTARVSHEPVPAWRAIPIVTAETLRAGFRGGEGAQVPRTLVISASQPDFLLMGTDVGGIYRSLDGGKGWQVCMSGWDSRGANAFAIDPRNARRIIGVGGNGNDASIPCNGLSLSVDQGASWRHVLPFAVGNDDRDSVAYDPASFDAQRGFCTVAYFDSRDRGLMKSTDGGETWQTVCKELSNGILRVHPTKGYVYLACNDNPSHGFYRSTNGGVSFQRTDDRYVTGLDVSPAAPEKVWISRWDKVQVSEDAGQTFHYTGTHWPTDGLPEGKPIRDLTVSPVEPRNMACWYDAGDWKWPRFYSTDGGDSWRESDFRRCGEAALPDGRRVAGTPLPYNNRGGLWAYHPVVPGRVVSTGGDWVTRSDDAGASFAWSNDGENAVMVGGSFAFSAATPDVAFLSFQDYNGAFTLDGGKTWNYRDVSGNGWGGYEYGGFALSKEVMWSGDAASWGGARRLKVTRDGGKTWASATDAAGKPVVFAGADVSGGDPKDAAVGFASNWRTADGGKTWTAMPGCEGVFCANPGGERELYGRHGEDIVCSRDAGVTWAKVGTVPGGITDLAYDAAHRRFWVASQDVLKWWEGGVVTTVETPKDQYGGTRVSSVAVDPVHPEVVYAANHKDIYACNNSVVRSTDGGKTWRNLAVTTPLTDTTSGGPHEVQWLRVHPGTRELWVAGQCYGMWALGAP